MSDRKVVQQAQYGHLHHWLTTSAFVDTPVPKGRRHICNHKRGFKKKSTSASLASTSTLPNRFIKKGSWTITGSLKLTNHHCYTPPPFFFFNIKTFNRYLSDKICKLTLLVLKRYGARMLDSVFNLLNQNKNAVSKVRISSLWMSYEVQ